MGLLQPPYHRLLSWVMAFLAALLMTGPAWLPGITYSGMDFTSLILPQFSWGQAVLRTGEWPLWNPQHWCGAPHLAAMQSMPLYPPALLLGWALVPITALQALNTLHLTILGAGTAAVARRLGARTPASCLAAVTIPLSGFVFGHLEQVNTLASCAWAPWILWAVLSLRRPVHAIRVGMFVALGLLSGHPHYTILSTALAGLTLAVRLLLGVSAFRRSTSARWAGLHRLLLALLGVIVGLGLAAPQLLPALELSQYSERVWPYTEPDQPRLEPSQLPGLLIPRYLNQLAQTPARPLGHTESGLFVGPAVFLLALCAIPLSLRGRGTRLSTSQRWMLRTAWIVLLVSLIYALGRRTPLFELINTVVPTLKSSRGAARTGLVTTILLCALAAVGLTRIQGIMKSRPAWSQALGWTPYALCGIQMAMAMVTHWPEYQTRLTPVEALATPPNHGLLDRDRPWNGRIHRFTRDDSNFDLDDRPTAVRQRFQRLQPSTHLLGSLTLTDGYEEGLLPTWAHGNFLRRWNRNLRQEQPDGSILRAMGARFLLTEYPLPDQLGPAYGPPRSMPAGLRSYELVPAPTLGFWVDLAQEATLQNTIQILGGTTPQTRSDTTPVRESTGQRIIPYLEPNWTQLPGKFPSPNRVTLSEIPNQAGIAVLRMWGYPGWKSDTLDQATVGRHPAPWMTVALPEKNAGENRTELSLVFRPASFHLGLFIGLVFVGGSCLLGLRSRFRAAYPTALP